MKNKVISKDLDKFLIKELNKIKKLYSKKLQKYLDLTNTYEVDPLKFVIYWRSARIQIKQSESLKSLIIRFLRELYRAHEFKLKSLKTDANILRPRYNADIVQFNYYIDPFSRDLMIDATMKIAEINL